MQNRKRPSLVAAALWLGFVWAAAPGGAVAQQADAQGAASSNPDSLDAFREVLRAALRGDGPKQATKHAGKHARPARPASGADVTASDAPAAAAPVDDARAAPPADVEVAKVTTAPKARRRPHAAAKTAAAPVQAPADDPRAAPSSDADAAALTPAPKARRHARAASKPAADAQAREEDPRAALSSDADVAALAASPKTRRHARPTARAQAGDPQAAADDPRAAESSTQDASAVAASLDARRNAHAHPTDFDPQAQAADPAAAEPAEDMPSHEILRMAQWVLASGDHGDRPFVVIDKQSAEVAVFDADGTLLGAAPALIGLARGDDSAPGIGTRKLAAITPDERTTPAGRFVAGYGPAAGKRPVLWVDYGTSISLHPVVTSNPREHRPERLQSASPDDRRITFGCINVSAGFYQEVVSRVFAGQKGVVYILPESRSIEEVFPAFASWSRTAPAPQSRISQAGP